MSFFATLASGGQPTVPGFLPFLEGLAADMEGVAESALAADPTRWANALPRAARLVDAQAILIGAADGVQQGLADALRGGADDTAAALIDTLERLAETQRGGCDLVVLMPGPIALLDGGDRVALDALKQRLVAFMEKLCASRPALVLVNEHDATALAGADAKRLFGTLKNVADYYGVALGMRFSGTDTLAAIAARRSLRLDHLLLAGAVTDAGVCLEAAAAAGWRSLGMSAAPSTVAEAMQGGPVLWFASAAQTRDIEALKAAGATAAWRLPQRKNQ